MTKRKPDLETPGSGISPAMDESWLETPADDGHKIFEMAAVIPTNDGTFVINPVQQAIDTLTASGILEAAESDRPQFRPGHLEHLAREYERLGKQEAWRLYADDLTVTFAFWRKEFEAMIGGQGEADAK